MLRSELVARVQEEFAHLRADDVEAAVDAMLEAICLALVEGRRVELRGFGAFSVRTREGRQGRNPRTGEAVRVAPKRVPFFRPGKELRAAVNGGEP